MDLQHKTIAITGGSGGIGAPLIDLLLAAGAKVTVLGRSLPTNPNVDFIKADLANLEGINAAATQLTKLNPDVLINLAGAIYFGLFAKQTTANMQQILHLNLLAPIALSQAASATMQQRGSGQIVNVGSILGSIGLPFFSVYNSSKAGLRTFSESLRRELRGSNVGVTYVAPRAVKTKMQSPEMAEFSKQTGGTVDSAEAVAKRIISALQKGQKDVYIGFPECIFVRLNYLLPRLVDLAVAGQTAIGNKIFK